MVGTETLGGGQLKRIKVGCPATEPAFAGIHLNRLQAPVLPENRSGSHHAMLAGKLAALPAPQGGASRLAQLDPIAMLAQQTAGQGLAQLPGIQARQGPAAAVTAGIDGEASIRLAAGPQRRAFARQAAQPARQLG